MSLSFGPRGTNPLEYLEESPPQTRAALLKLWHELAPLVRRADPSRYRCVEEALEQDIPFQVLVAYVHRESVRALEGWREAGSG